MFAILDILKDVEYYEYTESGYKETDDLEKVYTFYGEDMDIMIEYIIDVCYKRKYFQFKEYLVDLDIKVNNNIYFNLQDFIEIKRRGVMIKKGDEIFAIYDCRYSGWSGLTVKGVVSSVFKDSINVKTDGNVTKIYKDRCEYALNENIPLFEKKREEYENMLSRCRLMGSLKETIKKTTTRMEYCKNIISEYEKDITKYRDVLDSSKTELEQLLELDGDVG